MKAYGITLLRLTVGAIYLLHAFRLVRAGGGEMPAALARTAWLQDPSVMLWILIAVQGVGGLMILAGLFTRPAAAANTLVSGLAIARAVGHVAVGVLEFPVLLVAATLALLLLGSGPLALRPSR